MRIIGRIWTKTDLAGHAGSRGTIPRKEEMHKGTIMTIDDNRASARVPAWLVAAAGFAALGMFAPAYAQDAAGEAAVEEDEEVTEEIVVTGSRLKRDTYSSIAPLQVISGQVSREVGLIDAGDILQQSTASSGQQI